jgi:3-carboxy-cis,cis-muconate cycloisomerase
MTLESTTSPFSSTPEMERVFSLRNQLQQMTRFEWALCGALEQAGLAGAGSADAMGPLLDAAFVDVPALLKQAREVGNLAIPLVAQLTAAVRARSGLAANSIHLGATSQDVLDTAMVLQGREALALIVTQLEALDALLVRQARTHTETVLAGRTWLQDGPPVTLGLKIAGWIAALRRHKERIAQASSRFLVLQFGGAVGTLAALGDKGEAVSAALAQRLGLKEPQLPWHAHRDNVAEMAAVMGMLTGTLGKIARDVSLLMQTQVAEVLEPAGDGRGGSSTMPHKRNPVASAVMLAAATRVPGLVATLLSTMTQEHERGLGNWQAEWETLPEIFRLTAASLERAVEIAEEMDVRPEKMAANLVAAHGLAMSEAVSAALAAQLGREQAHALVERAAQRAIAEQRNFQDVLNEMPAIGEHLTAAEIERLLDPRNYLGSARRFTERVLGAEDAAS